MTKLYSVDGVVGFSALVRAESPEEAEALVEVEEFLRLGSLDERIEAVAIELPEVESVAEETDFELEEEEQDDEELQ